MTPSQWDPALFEGTANPSSAPHDAKNYHFDRDMADQAIDWIRNAALGCAGQAVLRLLRAGTVHAPHHAPREWIEKFKGKFDQGWDKVREETLRDGRSGWASSRPNAQCSAPRRRIPAWDSLDRRPEESLYAHMMEVYAGCLAYTDNDIGRVVDAIEEQGELDNTLVIYIDGDNGASGEGQALQGR